MTPRVGLLWDEKTVFSRVLQECGVSCEHVTPQMLATPFFRGRFCAIIVPTGFGNPAYSRLLPALRASSSRIRKFLENGGRLLVFGPGADRRDAYDWLPFRVLYTHRKQEGGIECVSSQPCASLFAGYDPSAIECDGFFPEHDCEVIARAGDGAVLIRCSAGSGEAVVTTVHEYPSQPFIRQFCSGTSEILL